MNDNDQRFQFIELGQDVEPMVMQPVGHLETRIIPDEQHLSYFDLMALLSSKTVLGLLTSRIISKYRCIPVAALLNHLKPQLPRHLKPEFHSAWIAESAFTLYVAMCEPFKEHTLRILHNATNYSICGIPLRSVAFERFMADDYSRLKRDGSSQKK